MAALASLSKLGVYFILFCILRTCFSQSSTSTSVGPVTDSTTNTPTTPGVTPTTPIATTTTTTPIVTTTTIAPNVPGTSIPTNTDISKCPCDLTGLSCDVNCCCDPDCSDIDKQVFSQCVRNSYRLDDKLCFDRDVILYENGPEYSNTTDDLFCIYFDNEEERNYYKTPSLITTEAKFKEYTDDYGKFSFQPAPVSSLTTGISNYYRSGDPLFIVFASQAASYLPLPTSLSASPLCTDGNPASYLIDQTVSCMRIVSNLANDCATSPAFIASTFFQDMRLVRELFSGQAEEDTEHVLQNCRLFSAVQEESISVKLHAGLEDLCMTIAFVKETRLQDPFLLQAFNSTTTVQDPVLGTVDLSGVTELYNNNFTLAFELDPNSTLRCISAAGVQSTCAFSTPPTAPTWDTATSTCQNVLTKVEYRFVTEGTFGVQNSYASFVFSDITTASVTQSFQTTFTTKTDQTDVVQRSGNPGYIVGQPIIAGILNETTELVTEVRGQQLALVKPSATGSCSTASSQREPVVFGQNMRTGCFIQVNINDNPCEDLQNEIINVQEGYAVPTYTGGYPKNYRYVAMFGDSSSTKTGDWVEILYPNRPQPPSPATADECNLPLGMDIQIIYANVGALPNPQPKIIGVSFVYDSPQIVKYKCSGPFCQPGASTLTQRVEISSSVTFIDASKSPQEVESEYPTFAVRLPYDFFYPFLNAGNLMDSGSSCLVICLLTMYSIVL